MSDPMEAVRRLLDLRHRGRVEDLPSVLSEAAPFLDAAEISALLIDYGQISLCPLRGTAAAPVPVESTVAGQAFVSTRMTRAPAEDGTWLWLPLLHGAERLGVLQVRTKAVVDDQLSEDLRTISALVAELIASRRFYGDAVEYTRRRLPMQLAAEIIWNQLPPLTFAVDGTVVTAVLEPCYDVGGDAFDYAANGEILHVALFDTVGHGIGASALTTLTLNTYRNARRSGLTLADTCRSIDKWIRAQFPGSFVTAVMAEFNTREGMYYRISAGHPAELWLRGGRPLTPPPAPTALPLGLGHMLNRGPRVTEHALEPGDALVLYTDGITEARDAKGELFGLGRLTDFVARDLAARTPAAEMMRRLIHTIVAYEDGDLRDDATAAMLLWKPAQNPVESPA
jgi:sigma-B regulation protein RsbU (phosphoserine phosphatase)